MITIWAVEQIHKNWDVEIFKKKKKHELLERLCLIVAFFNEV